MHQPFLYLLYLVNGVDYVLNFHVFVAMFIEWVVLQELVEKDMLLPL